VENLCQCFLGIFFFSVIMGLGLTVLQDGVLSGNWTSCLNRKIKGALQLYARVLLLSLS
jgi:hypothetical protein